jgi:uncharacterized membrane protein
MSAETDHNVPYRQFLTLLGTILFLTVITRIYHLGYESLWLDEAITFARSSLDFEELSDNAIKRYHNPTYFILIRGAMFFGDSEFVLRIPSAISGILKTGVVCGVGTLVGGRRLGLLSALLVVLMPAQLRYDQEARMYGIIGLTNSLVILSLIYCLKNPQISSSSLLSRNKLLKWYEGPRKAWALYGSASIVSLYLHNTSIFFVLACSLASLTGCFDSNTRRGFLRNWVIVHTLIALAFLPWLPTLMYQNDHMQQKGWWAVTPDTASTISTLAELYGIGSKNPIVSLIFVFFAIWGAYQIRRHRPIVVALVLLTLAGPCFFGLVTLYQPMFMVRLMLWSSLPFAVLTARGILAIPSNLAVRSLIGAVLISAATFLYFDYYGTRQKPNWQAAVEFLTQHVESSDAILAIGGAEARSVFYYLNRSHKRLPPLTIDFDIDRMAKNLQPNININGKHIWTIQARNRPQTVKITEQLSQYARRIGTFGFGPELTVEKFELKTIARSN